MKNITPMPGCGSCYHGSCDFGPICADYLSKHPDKCPDLEPQDNPALNGDENAQNEPEINETENSQTAAQPQVPPPVNPKRSCSAMLYTPDQTGVWAILLALLLGFVAIVRCRKS